MFQLNCFKTQTFHQPNNNRCRTAAHAYDVTSSDQNKSPVYTQKWPECIWPFKICWNANSHKCDEIKSNKK